MSCRSVLIVHSGDGRFRPDERPPSVLIQLADRRRLDRPQRNKTRKKKEKKVFSTVSRATRFLIRNSITVSHALHNFFIFFFCTRRSFIVVDAIRSYGVDLEILRSSGQPSRKFSNPPSNDISSSEQLRIRHTILVSISFGRLSDR